jgi:hypothetical protein
MGKLARFFIFVLAFFTFGFGAYMVVWLFGWWLLVWLLVVWLFLYAPNFQ